MMLLFYLQITYIGNSICIWFYCCKLTKNAPHIELKALVSLTRNLTSTITDFGKPLSLELNKGDEYVCFILNNNTVDYKMNLSVIFFRPVNSPNAVHSAYLIHARGIGHDIVDDASEFWGVPHARQDRTWNRICRKCVHDLARISRGGLRWLGVV